MENMNGQSTSTAIDSCSEYRYLMGIRDPKERDIGELADSLAGLMRMVVYLSTSECEMDPSALNPIVEYIRDLAISAYRIAYKA